MKYSNVILNQQYTAGKETKSFLTSNIHQQNKRSVYISTYVHKYVHTYLLNTTLKETFNCYDLYIQTIK
jgi:hypothetical protein